MKRRNDSRRSVGQSPGAMRTRSVACLLALAIGFLAVLATGCTTKVQYLRETEKVVHLKKDERAPHDGWLLSDDHLAELYDLLERKLPGESSPDE